MRVSLQWLQELVTAPGEALAVEALSERLSLAGFEVDAIEDLAAQAAGVVVGYVRDRQPHPNADKLSVCEVEVGATEPLQIVCGAANVRAGIHVPVALVGATLPAVNLTIKPAELRGVPSSGMICSLAELGLSADGDGIANLEQVGSEALTRHVVAAVAFELDVAGALGVGHFQHEMHVRVGKTHFHYLAFGDDSVLEVEHYS